MAGEQLPQNVKDSLKNATFNNVALLMKTSESHVVKRGRTRNHSDYRREIGEIFDILPKTIGIREKYFLGGFVEGEGSLNVSLKKLRTSRVGVLLDPEFSIAQHVNSIQLLYLALAFFQTGRLRYKSGSNATLVIVIDNREDLKTKIVPFYKKYVNSIGSAVKTKRLHYFERILLYLEEQDHRDVNVFVHDILPLWDSMRMQKGQSNQSFASLKDAQDYVLSHSRE